MTAGTREPLVRSERANGAEYGGAASRWAAPPGCVITADGAYGARLARDGESWYPERWTLDGPEPYAVPLPGPQPEEPGAEVLPLTDGRVLIHRVDDGRHAFSLLYPTGPGTGELPLGAVECPDAGTVLRLLPPAPDGERAYALAVGRGSTAVWLVAGGAFGPEHLAEVPGHCSGGVWLDGTGRLLALDRFQDGRTKTVVVDLERGGEVSPLLQIAEHSDDRLLLADADSGLLLIRSDAPSPGRARLGWGVLGSALPVRFPDCLNATGCSITPFAIQPGQVLTPESCAVALRVDGPGGTWVGMWRPSERRVHHRPAPEGWLPGTGLWTVEGVLRLPYVTRGVPCGVARLEAPEGVRVPGTGDPASPGRPTSPPVPLQQAPLRTGPSAGAPPRALPAPRNETVRAVDGPRPPHAGTGPVPEGRQALSTVTSLTARTSPAERTADEQAEPLRPVARRAPEATAPARPRPSRWTRVPLPVAPGQKRRVEPAGTPTTAPDLWTKVAETPPPGMGLRTRADGTLPGGMTVGTETAEPLPPVTRTGADLDTDTDTDADAGTVPVPGPGTGSGVSAGVSAGVDTGAGVSASTPAGVPANAGADEIAAAPAGPSSAEPLLPLTGPGTRTAEPLPAVAGPGAEPAGTLPPNPWADATGPGLWTKAAETPPPGTGPATGTGGTGNGAVPFSGGPGAVPHTGGEEKDTTGEETSPSDFRAVTAR